MRQCFYCDAPLTKFWEQDHWPVPERHGGQVVVEACPSCHDLKDRLLTENWPIEMRDRLMADMPKLNRELRIFVSKAYVTALDALKILESK